MKKLSILIPTFNRYKYLQITLAHLLPQIQRNESEVELVVCSNASKDETDEYIRTLEKEYGFLSFYRFDDFVEICDSFSRSIEKTSGEYVIMWGDDDIPAPYTIDFILENLKKYPNLGILHFNVMSGIDRLTHMTQLSVDDTYYECSEHIISLSDFLAKHTIDCGFITSMAFLRSAWQKGLPFHKREHYGYEFLGIIFHGIENRQCLYCDYPLVIKRMPFNRSWLNKWPQYALIGIPNMIHDFEHDGLTSGAIENWKKVDNSFVKFMKQILMASSYKSIYRPLCKQICVYQTSILRKILVYLVIYCVPAFVNNTLRKLAYK